MIAAPRTLALLVLAAVAGSLVVGSCATSSQVASKKDELTKGWGPMADSLTTMVGQLETRVAQLSSSRRLSLSLALFRSTTPTSTRRAPSA